MSELIAEDSALAGRPELSAARLGRGAAALASLITVLWGTNPTALKIALRGFPPIGSSGLRFGIAAVGVWLWCRLTKVHVRPQPGEAFWLAVTALFFVAQIATFTLGVYWGTAGHSIVLLHTYPFFVVALAHFLIPGERASIGKVLGLGSAFSGIIAIFAGEWGAWQGRQVLGDGVQLLSALLLGGQVVFMKHALARVDPSRVVLWEMICGAVVFVAYSFAFEGLAGARPGAAETAAVLYQGLVIGTFCFTIWTWLIRHHAASRVAIFGFIAPLIGVALSATILGEPLTPSLILGAALVAAGIVLANRF
jgi:drug/metabolite transporter (DMT)-like permease